MSAGHPLHTVVGAVLRDSVEGQDAHLILDTACGGNRWNPLFMGDKKSSAARICNVDALVIKNRAVRVVVEIEESNVKPTQVCGKMLTTAMASHFIHADVAAGTPLPLLDVLFIQVLDTTKLSNGSRKPRQWDMMWERMQTVLPPGGPVSDYMLMYGLVCDFAAGGKHRTALVERIRSHLA